MGVGAAQQRPVALTCTLGGELLGHIVNFGKPEGPKVRIRCPCGGSSQLVRLASLYKTVADGVLEGPALSREIDAAIEAARHPKSGK